MKVTVDTTSEEILDFIQKAMDRLKAESSAKETTSNDYEMTKSISEKIRAALNDL